MQEPAAVTPGFAADGDPDVISVEPSIPALAEPASAPATEERIDVNRALEELRGQPVPEGRMHAFVHPDTYREMTGEELPDFVVGVDPGVGRDETVQMVVHPKTFTVNVSGDSVTVEPTEASVREAVAQTLKRPEDNYTAPTELANRMLPPPRPAAPKLPGGRVLDPSTAAKLPKRAAPATTVEAFNREPAFAEPCQIERAEVSPGASRRSRMPAYQREGKRARAVGRAVLRQIEADKRKAAKRAERERRERLAHEARERELDDAAIPSSALDMIDFTGPNPLEK